MGRRALQNTNCRPQSRHEDLPGLSAPQHPAYGELAVQQNSSLKPITSLQQILQGGEGGPGRERENYPRRSQLAGALHHQENYPRRSEVGLQTESVGQTPQQLPGPPPANTERHHLERNLEALVAEQGVSVIGELTNQMSTQQIEMLVTHMKEKFASPDSRGSRQPIDLATIGELSLDKFLSQLSLHQISDAQQQPAVPTPPAALPPTLPRKLSKKRNSSGGSGAAAAGLSSVSSMPDLSDCRKSDTSSEDIQAEHKSPRHKPRKSNLSGKPKSRTDVSCAEQSNSTKNLNVRFDPSQVGPGGPGDRSPHSRRARSERHRSGRHKPRSSSRQRGPPQEISRTGSLPRSHSYSGRGAMLAGEAEDWDACSTCSSSSSDSDDPYAYQLPPRRAYGGVRISYVPNDRLALSGRRSLRVPQASGPAMGNLQPVGTNIPDHAQLRRDQMSQDRDNKDKNCIIS